MNTRINERTNQPNVFEQESIWRRRRLSVGIEWFKTDRWESDYIPEEYLHCVSDQPPPSSCPVNCSRSDRAGSQDPSTEEDTVGQSAASDNHRQVRQAKKWLYTWGIPALRVRSTAAFKLSSELYPQRQSWKPRPQYGGRYGRPISCIRHGCNALHSSSRNTLRTSISVLWTRKGCEQQLQEPV